MLTEKQVELLESVAVTNENVPDEKFDMGVWFCGTIGCLIGNWLASGPKTNGEKSLRLKTILEEGYSFPCSFIGDVQQCEMQDDALKDFFDFNDEQVGFLFFWENDKVPTRKQAITRLRNFIKTNGNINAALAMEE